MSFETTNRWLILEQESDRKLWTEKEAIDGLVWNEGGFTEGYPETGHDAAEAEFCVLFLPPAGNGRVLPDQFDNRNQWRWNVWCHYGRDITLRETVGRWETYERISRDCKRRLSADGVTPPLPFSLNMPQPWSEEFIELKKLVKISNGGADGFRQCLGLLRRAWLLATSEKGVQYEIFQSKEALPALLAARYVLEILPEAPEWKLTTLGQVLEQCRKSGLSAAAAESTSFSSEVREAYRKLHFSLLGARARVETGRQKLAACPDDDRPILAIALDHESTVHFHHIRDALEHLLRVGGKGAEAASEALIKHPAKILS